MLELKIDPEFKGKIPPLTTEEYTQLEENILKAGEIFNPIIVWNGYIVDGHNRYNIYRENLGKVAEPKVKEMTFADKWDAIAWMCKNQIGQRNLTPEQKEYLIGKQYEAEKHRHGTNQWSDQSDHSKKEKTRERIAKETNTSEGFVQRAEHFAQALDITTEVNPEFKDKVLRGEVKAPKTEIRELRNFEGEELKQKIEAIESGEVEKERKEKLKEAERERREKLKEEREEERAFSERIKQIIKETSGRVIVERTGADFLTEFSILFDEMKRTALRMIRQDKEVIGGYVRTQAFAKMDETIKEIKENYDGN